ncbi:hypothetical protein LCGC14_3059340 [marine sediment metagenome]|uniref:Uncharacterized protein n=1 Tax=marine sediment metagenome TaxID=412755 RepID=A0A0F8X7P5_9ZZZZ
MKEVMKYQTEDGKLFNEKWKAENYEIAKRVINKLGKLLGMPYTQQLSSPNNQILKKIFQFKKELKEFLENMERFDERILKEFFNPYTDR